MITRKYTGLKKNAKGTKNILQKSHAFFLMLMGFPPSEKIALVG